MTFLPYAVAIWLFIVGLYGVVTSRNLVHQIVCLSVMQSSTYVVFMAVGYRRGGIAPVLTGTHPTHSVVDPVAQAFASTDIVVGAAVTALLLAIAVQVHKITGSLDPDNLRPLERLAGPGLTPWSNTAAEARLLRVGRVEDSNLAETQQLAQQRSITTTV